MVLITSILSLGKYHLGLAKTGLISEVVLILGGLNSEIFLYIHRPNFALMQLQNLNSRKTFALILLNAPNTAASFMLQGEPSDTTSFLVMCPHVSFVYFCIFIGFHISFPNFLKSHYYPNQKILSRNYPKPALVRENQVRRNISSMITLYGLVVIFSLNAR